MAFRVLVIPEDPTHDQYMLMPLVKAALAHSGKPRATVRICFDPLIGGIATVLKRENLRQIVARNAMFDAFLLCVDRDCDKGRDSSLRDLDAFMAEAYPDKIFRAIAAIEELEVWLLAGLDNLGADWASVRSHCHPKEAYFEPYAAGAGIDFGPGGGRNPLGRLAASQYANRVRVMCPEIRVCESLAGPFGVG